MSVARAVLPFSELLLALALTATLARTAPAQIDRLDGAPFATRSEVIARNGMAATSQPLATQIAVDVLQAGGSAVDAAIAANAALGLMEPVGNGLGGDLFALVWDPETKQLWGLNGSGRSARGLDLAGLRERLAGAQRIPSYGPLCVTVPGCADGWGALHARFGRLPWKQVLAGRSTPRVVADDALVAPSGTVGVGPRDGVVAAGNASSQALAALCLAARQHLASLPRIRELERSAAPRDAKVLRDAVARLEAAK